MNKEKMFFDSTNEESEEEIFKVPEGASPTYKKLVEKLKNAKGNKNDFEIKQFDKEKNNIKARESNKNIITEIDINAHIKRKEELKTKKKELENLEEKINKETNPFPKEELSKQKDRLEEEIKNLEIAIRNFEKRIKDADII